MSLIVKTYRWIVFLLAAGYCIRVLLFSPWALVTGPFGFLTVWALLFSFFAASRMLALTEGRSDKRWDVFVSITAVLNTLVVLLFWGLFYLNPNNVTADGNLLNWALEGYLHALGPMLQWIDAVFINRAFRKLRRTLAGLFVVGGAYVIWVEGVVQHLNTWPAGSITTGLPYPFLNDMTLADRMVFYGGCYLFAVTVLLIFTALSRFIRRFVPASTGT